MRRRSEKKKSNEDSSPQTVSSRRVSRRTRKSESENNAGESEPPPEHDASGADGSSTRDSCDESGETRRRKRTRRKRTSRGSSSPARRKSRRQASTDVKIDRITEEENGSTNAEEDEDTASIEENLAQKREKRINSAEKGKEKEEQNEKEKPETTTEVIAPLPSSPRKSVDDKQMASDVLEIQVEDQSKEPEEESQPSNSHHSTPEEMETVGNQEQCIDISNNEEVAKEKSVEEQKTEESPNNESTTPEAQLHESVIEQPIKAEINNCADNAKVRKRKWLTKKVTESKTRTVSISTDSLKKLISDVHLAPLSDVNLNDSSSDIEEVLSEREEGEETPSPVAVRRRDSLEKIEKTIVNNTRSNEVVPVVHSHKVEAPATVQRSPSPARNSVSNVLYITNLVRPFTVLQLKGLLARTGKIVEDGFWIDRIKSKCYVQYETEDEAIETRHALHGVRWPVSNPKCLHVEFGAHVDMWRAIQSTKDDAPKFAQDNNRENIIMGGPWNQRIDIDDKKSIRPVREWDVGKKESLIEVDKNREREKRRSRDRDTSRNRENGKNEKDRKPHKREPRSSSASPGRKLKKKENDPPLRLLDDLFRKTKTTPCIYWLPLTPEQIAEKEAIRLKRVEEQKLRIKQRELDRAKEREKERNRGSDRDRSDRADHRRSNRSSDRRRSRSRDRRRY